MLCPFIDIAFGFLPWIYASSRSLKKTSSLSSLQGQLCTAAPDHKKIHVACPISFFRPKFFK